MARDKHIIFFDGVCNMCNSFVRLIIKLDYKEQFIFCPISSKKGKKIINKFNLELKNIDSIILLKNNKITLKSEAVIEILVSLNLFFRFFLILKILPSKLLDLIYDFIAKYRYKLFGRKESCIIPDEKYKSRFTE
jgi:predicted DCC family thiol-disulfide oxidoreductase YuxK